MSISQEAESLRIRYSFRSGKLNKPDQFDLEEEFREFLGSWPKTLYDITGSITVAKGLIKKINPEDEDKDSLDSRAKEIILRDLTRYACYLDAKYQESEHLRDYTNWLSVNPTPLGINLGDISDVNDYLLELETEFDAVFADIHGQQKTLCTIIATQKLEEEKAASDRPQKTALELLKEKLELKYPLHSTKVYTENKIRREFQNRVGGRYPWQEELDDFAKKIIRADIVLDDIAKDLPRKSRYLAKDLLEDLIPLENEFSEYSDLLSQLVQRADFIISFCLEKNKDEYRGTRPNEARQVKVKALRGLKTLHSHFQRLTNYNFSGQDLYEWVAHNELTKLSAKFRPNPGYGRR